MSKRGMLKKRVDNRKLNTMEIIERDVEQRRSTRMGAIIAIIAIVGTACGFLYRLALNAVDVLPQAGVMYWYVIVLCCFALASGVITCWDILTYVISDLKRYNVIDDSYREFDKISDEKYLLLFDGFKKRIIWLIVLLGVFIPLSAIYDNGGERWTSIIVTLEMLIFCFIYFCIWIKNTTKEEKINGIKKSAVTIVKWTAVAVLCFLFLAAMLISSEATLQIEYKKDGEIVINNKSSYEYKRMDIVIENGEGIIVHKEEPSGNDLLWAKENTYVKSGEDEKSIAEGIVVSGEKLYWNYIYNITEKINENEKCIISITVSQEEKYVVVKNEFIVKNGEFCFSQEKIVKEY